MRKLLGVVAIGMAVVAGAASAQTDDFERQPNPYCRLVEESLVWFEGIGQVVRLRVDMEAASITILFEDGRTLEMPEDSFFAYDIGAAPPCAEHLAREKAAIVASLLSAERVFDISDVLMRALRGEAVCVEGKSDGDCELFVYNLFYPEDVPLEVLENAVRRNFPLIKSAPSEYGTTTYVFDLDAHVLVPLFYIGT